MQRRKTSPRYTTCLFCFGLWMALTASAQANDFRIVPGQRIGAVTLGMSRQILHKSLRFPDRVRRLGNGVLQETWLSRRKTSRADWEQGIYWKWNFLTVDFRHNRVSQIEINSPRFATFSRLSTRNSSVAWSKQFKPFRSTDDQRGSRDPGGYPGTKHFMVYDDALQKGIAWRYGVWGDLAPEPDPYGLLEVVIVHPAGQQIILDPDGSNRFVFRSTDRHHP